MGPGRAVRGIPGAREFLTGLALLCGYEAVLGYAGVTVGKLLFGLRLRRAPGIGVGRGALAPLVRSVVLVGLPGMWILWWSSVREWLDTDALDAFVGVAAASFLWSLHFHAEAQGLHDVAAGSVVIRRPKHQWLGTYFSAWR